MKERMGRNEALVTAAEAAEMLGVTTTQVYRLVQNGTLSRAGGGLRQPTRFYVTDVEALREARAEPTSLVSLQKELYAERARRLAMERRLERVERVLCLRRPTIGHDESDILDLVERVHEALKDPPTEAMEIQEWCSTLLDVHEETFDLVERYTGDPEPWREMLLLAEAMYASLRSEQLDEDSESVYAELSTARRSLRQAAFFHVSRRRGNDHARRVIREAEQDLVKKINGYVNKH